MIDKDGHWIPADPAEAHLGGNTAGGNPNTFFPELWSWMIWRMRIESVFDVGCGEGHAMREFERHGCSVHGCDGLKRNADLANAACIDFTKHDPGMLITSDLIWCCEVVGQIEEQFVPNIIRPWRSKFVALTHQLPGQQGYHIVNGQPSAYWQGALAVAGYRVDHELTGESYKYGKTYWHQTGRIYRRWK